MESLFSKPLPTVADVRQELSAKLDRLPSMFGPSTSEPTPWAISDLAATLTKTASNLADSASTLATEAVTVKTREELAQRPGQHAITMARQHRDMSVRASQLEEAVKEKRRELEESHVRIEELQAAIAHREYILAHPVVRPPPDPTAAARKVNGRLGGRHTARDRRQPRGREA